MTYQQANNFVRVLRREGVKAVVCLGQRTNPGHCRAPVTGPVTHYTVKVVRR